jgi:tetratricopeptide (TPR) repeat protein
MTSSPQQDLTKAEINTQVQKFYQQGDEHAFRGEHVLAIECYTLAIALDANYVRAYCARGESSLLLEQYDRAERDFKIALKLSPASVVAEGGLARAYYGLSNYPAALIACNRSIVRDPENVNYYYSRALINKKLDNNRQILADCQFVLDRQPQHQPARWLTARAYLQLGNYQLALVNFDYYLNLQPDDVYGYYYRGICHERAHDLPQAMQDLNRAIALQSNRAIFYRRRGYLAKQLGDITAAMADFDRAIELDPRIAPAYINRANIYLSQGDYAQALIECNLAIRIDPGSIDAHYQRGLVNAEAGNLHAALADYHRLLQLDPHDLSAHLQRGWILFRLGEYSAVMHDCEHILAVERYSVPANYLMGVVQSLSGFKQEAIFSFTKVMDAEPSFVCALYHRGLLHHDLRHESRAIEDFKLAQEIQKRGLDTVSLRDETGLYAEGLALYHMSQLDAASEILHQAAAVAQKFRSAVFYQQIALTLEALAMN